MNMLKNEIKNNIINIIIKAGEIQTTCTYIMPMNSENYLYHSYWAYIDGNSDFDLVTFHLVDDSNRYTIFYNGKRYSDSIDDLRELLSELPVKNKYIYLHHSLVSME